MGSKRLAHLSPRRSAEFRVRRSAPPGVAGFMRMAGGVIEDALLTTTVRCLLRPGFAEAEHLCGEQAAAVDRRGDSNIDTARAECDRYLGCCMDCRIFLTVRVMCDSSSCDREAPSTIRIGRPADTP